jgi:hypothetical protein
MPALQQRRRTDVRYGSLADMTGGKLHVCFAPDNGHQGGRHRCPLSAGRRCQAAGYINFSLRACVDPASISVRQPCLAEAGEDTLTVRSAAEWPDQPWVSQR